MALVNLEQKKSLSKSCAELSNVVCNPASAYSTAASHCQLYRKLACMNKQDRIEARRKTIQGHVAMLEKLVLRRDELIIKMSENDRKRKRKFKMLFCQCKKTERNDFKYDLAVINDEIHHTKMQIVEYDEIIKKVDEDERVKERQSVRVATKTISEAKESIIECVLRATNLRKQINCHQCNDLEIRCFDCSIGFHSANDMSHISPSSNYDNLLTPDHGFLPFCHVMKFVNIRYKTLKLDDDNIPIENKAEHITKLHKQLQQAFFSKLFLHGGRLVVS